MSFNKIATGTSILGLLLFVVVFHLTQPQFPTADVPVLLTLLALYSFTEFFPLKRNQLTISLSMTADILIFVKFGILPIVLATQTLFLISRYYRERKLELWRTIANMGMFLLATCSAASTFYLVGGTNQVRLDTNWLPILCYIAVHFLINHVCLFLYFRAMNGVRLLSYVHNIRFDLFSTLFASSLGLIMLLLYQGKGLNGLLTFGFPLVFCIYVFKLFNDVSRSSGLFRNLANLTGDFSGELEVSTMSTRVTEELPKWFTDVFCMIIVQKDGLLVPLSVCASCPDDSIDAVVHYLQHNEQAVEQPTLIRHLNDLAEFAPLPYHALLIAPFQPDAATRGFCCLLAKRFNEFDARTLDGVAILANQLAVSFRNALRYESVEKQSLYDELTKLPNHRFCERRLAEEVMRCEGNSALSLLLIDLDHFKKVNDQYGHQAGNVVLYTIARTFERCLRKSDFVARYGGEEFIVVLPGAGADLAFQIGEKIRNSVEAMEVSVPTMEGESQIVKLTVSIGVATYPDHAGDAQQLVRYADRAMYHGAKRAGRNRVAIYQKENKEKIESKV